MSFVCGFKTIWHSQMDICRVKLNSSKLKENMLFTLIHPFLLFCHHFDKVTILKTLDKNCRLIERKNRGTVLDLTQILNTKVKQ